jgi:peptidyl-tRNA hydrolase
VFPLRVHVRAACVSVLMANLRDAEVTAYTDPAAAAQMHKVVLSAKDESELVHTAELLQKNSIKHVLWTEQPEHMRTCLAVRPYPRKIIQPLLKHLKLFR